jgi:hypothetical protein
VQNSLAKRSACSRKCTLSVGIPSLYTLMTIYPVSLYDVRCDETYLHSFECPFLEVICLVGGGRQGRARAAHTQVQHLLHNTTLRSQGQPCNINVNG